LFLGAGELRLDSESLAQRDGHELTDESIAGVDAVEPRLVGDDHVVLRIGHQGLRAERLAGNGIDTADPHLQDVRLPPRRPEAQPERLGSTHRDDELPLVDTVYFHRSQARGQRVLAAVVGDAERPVQRHAAGVAQWDGVRGRHGFQGRTATTKFDSKTPVHRESGRTRPGVWLRP
jgi:hypothetical protein